MLFANSDKIMLKTTNIRSSLLNYLKFCHRIRDFEFNFYLHQNLIGILI